MSIKTKERKIPTKNYLIALFVMLGIVFITFYIFQWYEVYNNEKITKSYLVSSNLISNEITSLDELQDVLSEAPSEYFLYISYTNDENIYNMETKLKKVIKKYQLEDKFYYFNVTELKNNDAYIDEINSMLDLTNEKITNIPTILYYKDHKLVNGGIIKKDNNSLMQAEDFEQMLDKLEVVKN